MESYSPSGGAPAPSTEKNINDFQNLGNIWKRSFDVLQEDNCVNSNQVHHDFDLPTDYDPRSRPPYIYRQCDNVNTGGGNLSFFNTLNFYGGVVERNHCHMVAPESQPYPYDRFQPTSDQNRVRIWSCPQPGRHENLARPVARYPEVNDYYWNYGANQAHAYASYSETLIRGEGQRSNAQYFPHSNEQYQVCTGENDASQFYHYDQSVADFSISTQHDPHVYYVAEPNTGYYQFQPTIQESSEGSHQNGFHWQEVPKKRKPRYFHQQIDPTPSTSSAPSTLTLVQSEELNTDTASSSSSFTVSLPGGKPLFTIPLVGLSTSASEGNRPMPKKKKSRTVVYRSESYWMEKFRKHRVDFPVSSMDIPKSNMEDSRSIPSPELFNYNLDSDSEVGATSARKKREPPAVLEAKTTYKMCPTCKKAKWRNKISRVSGRCKCKDKSQGATKSKVSGEAMKQATSERYSSRSARSKGKHSNDSSPRSSSAEIVYSRKGRENRHTFDRDPNTIGVGKEISQDMDIEPANEMGLPDPQLSILDMPDIFQLFESSDSSAKGGSSSSSTDGGNIARTSNKEKGLVNQETPHSSEGARTSVSQGTPIGSSSSSDEHQVAEFLSHCGIKEKGRNPSDDTCQKTQTVARSIEAITHANNGQHVPSACFSDISEDSDNTLINDELPYSLSEGEIISDEETSEVGNNFGESEHFSARDEEVVTSTTPEGYPLSGNGYFGMLKDKNEALHQQETTYNSYGARENQNRTISNNGQHNSLNGFGRVYAPLHSLSFRPQYKVTYNGAPILMTGNFNRGPYDSEMIPLEDNQNRYSNMNICITPAHQQERSHLRDLYQNTSYLGQSNTGPFAHLLSNITRMPPSINHNPFDNQSEGTPWQLRIQESCWNNCNAIQNGTVINVVGQGINTIPTQLDFNDIGDDNRKSQTGETCPVPKMANAGSATGVESRLQSKGRICKFDEEGVKTVTRIAHKIISQTRGTGKSQNQGSGKCPPIEPSNMSTPLKTGALNSVKAKSDVIPSARLGKMLKKFANAVGRKKKVSRIQERLMEDVQKVYKLGSTSESGIDTSRASLKLKEVSMSIPGYFERRLRSRQEKESILQVSPDRQNNTMDQVERGTFRIFEPENCAAEMSSNVTTPCSTDGDGKMDIAQSDSVYNDYIPVHGNRTPSSEDDDDILSLHADTSLDDIL